METMYEYRYEAETPILMEYCDYCGYQIPKGETFYNIDEVVICKDCLNEFICIAGEE